MDDHFELVAAAFDVRSGAQPCRSYGLHIPPDRAYGSFAEMATAEAKRRDRIDAVSIVTPIIFIWAG